jgi:tRNA (adenine37-N6)-methyltransferase
MDMIYKPIGTIHTPFVQLDQMPIQPGGAKGTKGTIEIFTEFVPALEDLDGFSHIYLLYHFHRAEDWEPLVTPFLDRVQHGLFSTRAPRRPNPIGLSIVQLLNITGGEIKIENVDMLDGTPLLDIKPYVPDFDQVVVTSLGWLQDASSDVTTARSDNRFLDRDS